MNRFILNVATRQNHYCRVELPETIESDAIEKAKAIAKMFGAAFECTLTCWNDVGKRVSIL